MTSPSTELESATSAEAVVSEGPASGEVSAEPDDASNDTVPTANQPTVGLTVLVGVCLLLLLLSNRLLPFLHPVIDTLGNFQLQWAAVLIALIAYQLLRRRFVWALVLAALTAFPVYNLSQFFVSAAAGDGGPITIKMLTMNILTYNNEYQLALELIEERDPDIVNFVEYDEFWMKHVDGKLPNYPYRIGPQNGNVMYSKFPVRPLETRSRFVAPDSSFGCGGIAWVGDQQVLFWVVHTLSPTSPDRLRLRDQQINSLTDPLTIQSRKRHAVIAGDFNATTHCHSLDRMVKSASLIDSRIGRGIQNSWPIWFPPMSICIDHVFVSEKVRVHKRQVERSVGSDHRPVYIEVSFEPHQVRLPVVSKQAFNDKVSNRFESD